MHDDDGDMADAPPAKKVFVCANNLSSRLSVLWQQSPTLHQSINVMHRSAEKIIPDKPWTLSLFP